jgi:hypothetical protein
MILLTFAMGFFIHLRAAAAAAVYGATGRAIIIGLQPEIFSRSGDGSAISIPHFSPKGNRQDTQFFIPVFVGRSKALGAGGNGVFVQVAENEKHGKNLL